MKLTMITINGVTKFVMAPVSEDGRVRVSMSALQKMFGFSKGECIRFGP